MTTKREKQIEAFQAAARDIADAVSKIENADQIVAIGDAAQAVIEQAAERMSKVARDVAEDMIRRAKNSLSGRSTSAGDPRAPSRFEFEVDADPHKKKADRVTYDGPREEAVAFTEFVAVPITGAIHAGVNTLSPNKRKAFWRAFDRAIQADGGPWSISQNGALAMRVDYLAEWEPVAPESVN